MTRVPTEARTPAAVPTAAQSGLRILALNHSALIVADVDRAVRFYRDILGLTEVPRPAAFTFHGAWLRGPSFEVHLIDAADTTAQPGSPDGRAGASLGLAHHLAFEVPDIVAAETVLRVAGVPVTGGPVPRGDGVVQLYARDPDGHLLEFFAWAPASAVAHTTRPTANTLT